MAIDTKKMRGSLINLSLPVRPWTSEPDGLGGSAAHLSIMGYAARDIASSDIIDSKFARYTETQDDTLLRKWGRTALPSMTAAELRWCIANEISGSSTDVEKKWARKIV